MNSFMDLCGMSQEDREAAINAMDFEECLGMIDEALVNLETLVELAQNEESKAALQSYLDQAVASKEELLAMKKIIENESTD